MNDADIIPDTSKPKSNCIELTMVPSSGLFRVPSSGVWPRLDTVNWKLESASDRGGFIAAGTFEPNSTARIPTTTCWEDDITLPIIDCALLYVDDPSYKYYGKMQVVWNGTVWDPAIDTSSNGQRNMNHAVVWLGDKCHDHIDKVCVGTGHPENDHLKYLLEVDLMISNEDGSGNIQEANTTDLWELDWGVNAYLASSDNDSNNQFNNGYSHVNLGNMLVAHNVRYRPGTTHRTLQCMERHFQYPSACIVFGLSKKSAWAVSSLTLKVDGREVQTNDHDNWDCNIDMFENYIVTPLLGCSDDLLGLSGAAIASIAAGVGVASGLVLGWVWCYCRSRPRFHREDQKSVEANKKRNSDTANANEI
mmetsp:Transcript_61567/g.74047  ORF Transcript_61567/g.74047 Transcript_61567/m.74047 type:complete len:363 (+) Transcript_61567:326-1414(+)